MDPINGMREQKIVEYCLYARRSTEDDERQAMSIDSQIKEMTDIATRDGLFIKELRQEKHSAKMSGTRPVFNQLLTDIRSGFFTGILNIPKKKPPGKQLSWDEKETNRIISSYRVIVEHAIAGIKRYRCMSEKLRNKKPFIDDTFLLFTAGLWNYHLAS